MRQALSIVFKDGLATPFRTVGPASVTAWFFQYSVMGFIFQLCDRSLSNALSVEPVAYGEQLMEPLTLTLALALALALAQAPNPRPSRKPNP
tara:strand:- start:58 stop:333 length:276 start_codon:yes stop_codon:yes gene_type:complete